MCRVSSIVPSNWSSSSGRVLLSDNRSFGNFCKNEVLGKISLDHWVATLRRMGFLLFCFLSFLSLIFIWRLMCRCFLEPILCVCSVSFKNLVRFMLFRKYSLCKRIPDFLCIWKRKFLFVSLFIYSIFSVDFSAYCMSNSLLRKIFSELDLLENFSVLSVHSLLKNDNYPFKICLK